MSYISERAPLIFITTMANHVLCWFFSALLVFGTSHGSAIVSCPQSVSSYFIADDVNPCVFYWCLNGALISDAPMNCAPGSGVPSGYRGEGNPCTMHISKCKLQNYPQVPPGGGYPPHRPHYPAPPPPQLPPNTVPAPTPAPPSAPAPPPTGDHGYYAATAYLTQNAHIPGGMLQAHVHSLKYCWKACVYSYNCKGFDYDPRYSTCWLHTDKTICAPLEYKAYVNNFRLVFCPSSTEAPPTTVTMTTPAPTPLAPTPSPVTPPKAPLAAFEGSHLQGGILQPNINTKEACLDVCQKNPSCQGVDFDIVSNTCWLHTVNTECRQLVPKLSTTHYRYNLCEEPVTFPSSHALGGTLIPSSSDPLSCFALCVDPCVGVDFDSSSMSCWHHTETTCRQLEIKAQCVHLRRPNKCL